MPVGRRLAVPWGIASEDPLQRAAGVLLVAGGLPVHGGLVVRPYAERNFRLDVHIIGALGVVGQSVAALELLERDLPTGVLLLLAERLVDEAVQPAIRDEVLVAVIGLCR